MISSYSNETWVRSYKCLYPADKEDIENISKEFITYKSKKLCKLAPKLKRYNQEINKKIIRIEYVFDSFKIFAKDIQIKVKDSA